MEGLFVFALGGATVTYFVAPFLDNIYSKMNGNLRKILCIIFCIFFAADMIYSSFYPNKGEGITFSSKNNYLIRDVLL